MRLSKFILSFLLLLAVLFGCNNSHPATPLPGNTAVVVMKPDTTRIYMKSLGIMATIPIDHIKDASKNIFRLYSPDNLYEYFLTWEQRQTPDMMRRAFKAGIDMGNGMFSRYKGEIIPINAQAEAFEYGIYLFENSEQILSGYEIHDWSSSNGVLVINVMGTKENASMLKDRALNLYNSIEILDPEKLAELKTKIEQDRITLGRNPDEEMYYTKVADHTLLNVQMTGGNPPLRTEQRFELCNAGIGTYLLKSAGASSNDELVSGNWDIVEDEDGVMLLVIHSPNRSDDKWAIGLHKSGNVTIGGIEFVLHPKGSSDGPGSCN